MAESQRDIQSLNALLRGLTIAQDGSLPIAALGSIISLISLGPVGFAVVSGIGAVSVYLIRRYVKENADQIRNQIDALNTMEDIDTEKLRSLKKMINQLEKEGPKK